MIARGTIARLIMLLALLVVITAAAVVLLMEGYYLFLGLSIVAVGILIYLSVKLYNKAMTKATYMFNAIENDDLTFRFAENMLLSSDKLFNASLNRIRDLVGQTRAEVARRERYYEQILSQAGSGIVVADTKGVVYQANQAVLSQLGLTTLTHLRQLELISHPVAIGFMEVTKGKPVSVAFYNDVEQKRLSLVATDAELHKVGQVKIIAVSDATAQIDQTELDSWIKMSRVLTHEIMNSLSPVTSLSDSLAGSTDVAMMQKGLSVIGSTAQSLLRFVDNFRQFMRVSQPVMRDFVLRDMLVRSATLFANRKIEVKCPEDLLINADENLIGQVVVNLLKNGVEATGEDGKIWVRAARCAGFKVAIAIGNDGVPIPAEVRENIFVPFFTTKPSGSGIGLSLSRQILRLHGGTLTINSNSPHTEFILLF